MTYVWELSLNDGTTETLNTFTIHYNTDSCLSTVIDLQNINQINYRFGTEGAYTTITNFTDSWSESIGVANACGEMTYELTDSDTGMAPTFASIQNAYEDPSILEIRTSTADNTLIGQQKLLNLNVSLIEYGSVTPVIVPITVNIKCPKHTGIEYTSQMSSEIIEYDIQSFERKYVALSEYHLTPTSCNYTVV